MIEVMTEVINISDDITIRKSESASWYICDHISDCEIELDQDELNKIAMQSEVAPEMQAALEEFRRWQLVGDSYLPEVTQAVNKALALVDDSGSPTR